MKTHLNAKCGLVIYKQALIATIFEEEWNNWIAEKREQGGLSQKSVFILLERLSPCSSSRLSTIRAVRRSDSELEKQKSTNK